ncbi:hypothetical protein UVI_02029230 [Ustilaginoidea virens]|uniref:Integral membrane protein n=1 Tax=Ustilaginoidea virens TaxID=1159556 RepID=A0A1B5KW00_USTVR|nr:hypothetical protein UVI_02029230 [Ustilaginoidea virens]
MAATPPLASCLVGFLLVGLAWGLTTPFIRRAARAHRPPPRAARSRSRCVRGLLSVLALVRSPAYALPLLLNLSGSVWFFLLVGRAGML